MSAFFSYSRFESNFNSDVSSFLMLKNPKPKKAGGDKAASGPGSTMKAAAPAKGKKGKK